MYIPLLLNEASKNAEEVIASYAFSATLAIQDITHLASSGVSAVHIAKRLESSTESQSFLFALSTRHAPRATGKFGYGQLSSADLLDVAAWVFISLPLLEDRNVLEASITLDAAVAPLPGEPLPEQPWQAALQLIDELAGSLQRPIRQIWITQAPHSPPHPFLNEFGYTAAYTEKQATFPLKTLSTLPPTAACDVVYNMDFAPDDIDAFLHLLSDASAHYPRGALQLDSVTWTNQRLTEAAARLRDRGGNQLTAIARDATGTPCGLAEAVRFRHDDKTICELGLVYLLPEQRGHGLGMAMIASVLEAACKRWEDTTTCYVSYPAHSPQAQRMMKTLTATTITISTAWQKSSNYSAR